MSRRAEGTRSDFSLTLLRGAMTAPIAFGAVCLPAQANLIYARVHISPAAILTKSVFDNPSDVARRILNDWVESTAFHSSPMIILNSTYFTQARMLRGTLLVDDVLSMLDVHPYHALLALGELVTPLPFSEDLAGDVYGQVRAWKEWASEGRKDYLTDSISELGDNGMGRDQPL